MELKTVVGLLGGSLTTISLIPQVVKTWKTRSTKDLSLGMLSIFTAGILLWLFYGILLREVPIILANSATLVMAAILLGFKIRYK
jgi:MtN3 and saliva related transmembrane protein